MKKILILLTLVTAIFLLTACNLQFPNFNAGGGQTPEECEHELVTSKGKDPTCTTAGYTGTQTCINCGEVVVESEVIAPTGHKNIVDIPPEEATCLKAGSTAGKKCLACNKNLVIPATIPQLDHVIVSNAEIPATCTTAGSTGGKHCSVCFTVTEAATVLAPFGHDRGLEHIEVTKTAVASTCKDNGYTDELYCHKCDQVIIESKELPLADHKAEDLVLVPGYSVTCTEDGLSDGYFCTYCETTAVEQVAIPVNADAHPADCITILPAVAVTCYSDGLTEGSHCSNCDKDVVAQEAITERPAHTLSVKVGEDGNPINAITPDCASGTKGRTAHMECTNEGCDYEEASVELPYEHNYGDWEIVIEPTTENAGEKKATCSDCGDVTEEEIPAISDELGDIDPDGTV